MASGRALQVGWVSGEVQFELLMGNLHIVTSKTAVDQLNMYNKQS